MKRIFLLTYSALAFATSAHADNPQTVILSSHAEEDARNRALAQYQWEHRLDYQTRLPGLTRGLADQDLRARQWQAAHPVVSLANDLALGNQYDDVATIKTYLHDSGYTVNDEQASNARSYMLAHGIKHVSELGL